MKNIKTGKCLDLNGSSGNDDASIGTYGCQGSDNQKWVIEGKHIKTPVSSKCMDVQGGFTQVKSGQGIVQFGCDNLSNKNWFNTY